MFETFNLALTQILMMFTFMALGYVLRKSKLVGEDAGGVLSLLEVKLFLPALCFSTFATNFSREAIFVKAPLLAAGIIVLLATFFPAKLLAKAFAKTPLQEDVYKYSFLVPNIGYMGYPLVEGVFGSAALFDMMMFVIPYNIIIYTYGMYVLNPKREWSWKAILNPNIIAITIGMVIGFFAIPLPAFLDKTIVAAKNCMSPIALLLTGYVLAAIPVKPILADIRLYAAAFVRAVAIPGLAMLIMYLLKIDSAIMLIATATLAMPMGLNSVVFPEAFGGDSVTGAKTCFVSNVMSIVTIPLIFAVLGMLNVY